jgi:hypothetical protein
MREGDDHLVQVKFDLQWATEDEYEHARVGLAFPSWVPQSVCEMAVAMWRIDAEDRPPSYLHDRTKRRDAILRLAGDSRMRTVWGELRKKHRRVDAPIAWSHWHNILGGRASLVDRTPDEIALALFFHRAAFWTIRDMAWRDAKKKPKLSRADGLRFEAGFLDAVDGRMSEECIAFDDSILRFFDDFGLRTANDPPTRIPAIRRVRGERRVRLFADLLASVTNQLFGEVLHGTVAKTVNVALDLKGKQQITGRDVKNWWSRDWAHKNRK